MKLYYAPRTRSVRARWILEELGVDFELVVVNLTEGEHKQADYLKVHPLGRVPALIDGELALFESGAICLYLADKFPKGGLVPAAGPARGHYFGMMALAMAELDPSVATIFEHRRQKLGDSPMLERAQRRWEDTLLYLEGRLADRRPWILGDTFSAADIMLGSVVIWAQTMGLVGERPNLGGYIVRLIGRPAYQRAAAV